MNEEIAIKICEQMKDDIDNLCDCCRKDEKNRTCIGCRELAIETILKENARLKDKIEKAISYISEYCLYDEKSKDFNDDLDYYEIPKLLEILKGGD